jgi:hypothetical protein
VLVASCRLRLIGTLTSCRCRASPYSCCLRAARYMGMSDLRRNWLLLGALLAATIFSAPLWPYSHDWGYHKCLPLGFLALLTSLRLLARYRG